MSRAPKVTWARLRAMIKEGRGQGHGEAYQPWIQLRRWNPSPSSTQGWGKIPPLWRDRHMLCRSEWLLGILFSWVGAEVREQFPLWPFPHPHPLYGLDSALDADLPISRGLLALCAEAGIAHGQFPGTDVLYIWTMDLVLTWLSESGGPPRCVFVSVKPVSSERYQSVDPLDRGPQKLEIERRYAASLEIPYYLGDRTRYPGPLLGQLEWLKSAAYPPATERGQALLARFLDRHGHELGQDAPAAWIWRLQQDLGAEKAEADYTVQHCLWHQHLDCDLSLTLDLERLPQPGGRALRRELRRSLLGGEP